MMRFRARHRVRLARSTIARRLAEARDRSARWSRVRRGSLNWAILVSAPDDPTALRWGDTAFAQDLADSLTRLGQRPRIDFLGSVGPHDQADVVIALRGLHRRDPTPGAINYLWVISHPDAVTRDEVDAGWSRVFAASGAWERGREFGAEPLLQAASPRRFEQGTADPSFLEDVLFVGTSRGVERPVVRDAIGAGAHVAIYGHDWERFVDSSCIRADHLEFARVPAAYRSARIVLNDHWDDMRRNGFMSNRLFDATFVGANVISDRIAGMDDVFQGLVKTYDDPQELSELLTSDAVWPTGIERARTIETIRRLHSFDARATTLLRYALADSRRRTSA